MASLKSASYYAKLENILGLDEGYKTNIYLDTSGKATVGKGILLAGVNGDGNVKTIRQYVPVSDLPIYDAAMTELKNGGTGKASLQGRFRFDGNNLTHFLVNPADSTSWRDIRNLVPEAGTRRAMLNHLIERDKQADTLELYVGGGFTLTDDQRIAFIRRGYNGFGYYDKDGLPGKEASATRELANAIKTGDTVGIFRAFTFDRDVGGHFPRTLDEFTQFMGGAATRRGNLVEFKDQNGDTVYIGYTTAKANNAPEADSELFGVRLTKDAAGNPVVETFDPRHSTSKFRLMGQTEYDSLGLASADGLSNGNALPQTADGYTIVRVDYSTYEIDGLQYTLDSNGDLVRPLGNGQWDVYDGASGARYLETPNGSFLVDGSQVITLTDSGVASVSSKPQIYKDLYLIDPGFTTSVSLDSSGRLVQTVDRDIAGHRVVVEFVEDEWGDLKPSRVLSVDGQAPTDSSTFVDGLLTNGYDSWGFADGYSPSGDSLDNIYSANDPMGPGTLQALSTWIDFFQAVRTGKPLPIVSSGIRLAALYNPGNLQLQNAGAVFGGASGLLALQRAIKHDDLLGGLAAGAQTIRYGAQLYAGLNNMSFDKALEAGLFGEATGFIKNIGQVAAAINIINAVVKGDGKSAMLGLLAMEPSGIGAVVSFILNIATYREPLPYGEGRLVNNADGSLDIAINFERYDGGDVVRQVLQQLQGNLENMVKSTNNGNLGIATDRLDDLTNVWSNSYGGHFVLEPVNNHATGNHIPAGPGDFGDIVTQRKPFPYDGQGNRDPSGPGAVEFGSEDYFRNVVAQYLIDALSHGAIAPQWEIQTVQRQVQRYGEAWQAWVQQNPEAGISPTLAMPKNLLYPGASELDGAAAMGKLAPAGAAPTFKPILLDAVDGDGAINTLDRNDPNNKVAFDIDSSGYLRHTAWAGKNPNGQTDLLLGLDRNLNDIIDGGEDLFSNALVADDMKGVPSLFWVDADRNGVVDQSDPVRSRKLDARYAANEAFWERAA